MYQQSRKITLQLFHHQCCGSLKSQQDDSAEGLQGQPACLVKDRPDSVLARIWQAQSQTRRADPVWLHWRAGALIKSSTSGCSSHPRKDLLFCWTSPEMLSLPLCVQLWQKTLGDSFFQWTSSRRIQSFRLRLRWSIIKVEVNVTYVVVSVVGHQQPHQHPLLRETARSSVPEWKEGPGWSLRCSSYSRASLAFKSCLEHAALFQGRLFQTCSR